MVNYLIHILPETSSILPDGLQYPGGTHSHPQSEIYITVSTNSDQHKIRCTYSLANLLDVILFFCVFRLFHRSVSVPDSLHQT